MEIPWGGSAEFDHRDLTWTIGDYPQKWEDTREQQGLGTEPLKNTKALAAIRETSFCWECRNENTIMLYGQQG